MSGTQVSSPSIPSDDFADIDTLLGMLRTAFRKEFMRHEKQLPAKLLAYDRASNVASVQVLVQMLDSSGNLTSREQYASVPVLAYGGGGFVINFPLSNGDLGWIEASDRDISLFSQSLNEAGPNTNRIHAFSDGRFIPDKFSSFTVNSADENGMVIQNLDGTMKISMTPTKLTLLHPTAIVVDTPSFTLQNSAGTETASMNGNYAFVGTTLTHNGKNIGSTHVHTGVTTGGGDTGAPV
jgi:hypothetical protein